MFHEFDIVRLKENDLTAGVLTSYTGIIVDIVDGSDCCTVEFFDDNGDTIYASVMKEYFFNELVLVESTSDKR